MTVQILDTLIKESPRSDGEGQRELPLAIFIREHACSDSVHTCSSKKEIIAFRKRPFNGMFTSVLLGAMLLMLSIQCQTDRMSEWSSCSGQCHPGYKYRVRRDDQSIEVRSCVDQTVECTHRQRETINGQRKTIQLKRRQDLSYTLIQVTLLLSVAILLTVLVTCIASMYLRRNVAPIDWLRDCDKEVRMKMNQLGLIRTRDVEAENERAESNEPK